MLESPSFCGVMLEDGHVPTFWKALGLLSSYKDVRLRGLNGRSTGSQKETGSLRALCRSSKTHIGMRIVHTMVSGILVLGLRTRM